MIVPIYDEEETSYNHLMGYCMEDLTEEELNLARYFKKTWLKNLL